MKWVDRSLVLLLLVALSFTLVAISTEFIDRPSEEEIMHESAKRTIQTLIETGTNVDRYIELTEASVAAMWYSGYGLLTDDEYTTLLKRVAALRRVWEVKGAWQE